MRNEEKVYRSIARESNSGCICNRVHLLVAKEEERAHLLYQELRHNNFSRLNMFALILVVEEEE